MASSPTPSSSSSPSAPRSSFTELPVAAIQNEIVEEIMENRNTLIVGESGCDLGKGERLEALAIPKTGMNTKVLYLEQISELLGMDSEDLSLKYCSAPSPKMAHADLKPEVHKLIHDLVLHIHKKESDIEKNILVFLPTYVLWFPRFGPENGEGQMKNVLQSFFTYLAIRIMGDAQQEVKVILTMDNARFSNLEVERLARDCFFVLSTSFPFDESRLGTLFDEVTTRKLILVSKPVSYIFELKPPSLFQFGVYPSSLHQQLYSLQQPALVAGNSTEIIPFLSQDIIGEILSRLPVKSIVRFRCVSKSWLYFISSQQFVHAHRQMSSRNVSSSHVVMLSEWEIYDFPLQNLLSDMAKVDLFNQHEPFINGSRLKGSCHGLVCLFFPETNRFGLWNPSVRKYADLPYIECQGRDLIKVGLGWDEIEDDYNIFLCCSGEGGPKSSVYSWKRNAWKVYVEQGSINPQHASGVYARGHLYWLAEKKYIFIEDFDLGKKKFGRIELPLKPSMPYYWKYKLAQIGGCLHVIGINFQSNPIEEHVIIWMIDSRRSGMVARFSLELGIKPYQCNPVIIGGANGEIVLLFSDSYAVYHPDSMELNVGKTQLPVWEGYAYCETLVAPKFNKAESSEIRDDALESVSNINDGKTYQVPRITDLVRVIKEQLVQQGVDAPLITAAAEQDNLPAAGKEESLDGGAAVKKQGNARQ